MDLIVKNGTVVTDGMEMHCDLGVTGGRVTHWGCLDETQASAIIDASEKLVLPGLVDIGVSLLGENNFTIESQQTFETLTAKAIQGGVTTIVAAAKWNPARIFNEELSERRKADEAGARADFGYHYFVSSWAPEFQRHFRTAVSGGVPTAWIARTDLDAPLPAPALVHAVLRDLSDHSLAITSPSDPIFEDYFRSNLKERKAVGPEFFTQVFPEWIEEERLRILGSTARSTRGRLIVLGLSTARSVAALQSMREEGVPIFGAAALPFLALNSDSPEEEGAENPLPITWPPVRGRSEQQCLWNALEAGTLSVLTALHHPVTPEQIRVGQEDATSAVCGIGGIEHLLPLVYSEGVAKWRLSMESLSQCACADPAKLAGLYPKKGSLQIGSDADFVIFDPAIEESVPETKPDAATSPYAELEPSGGINAVYLRGSCIFGSNAVPEPRGRFLDRRISLA